MTIAAALALAGVLATVCPPPPGDWPLSGFSRESCPQVYRIQGTAPPHAALNIVVLPDAFTADELDDYRCAAGLMVEKLVASAPFHEFSGFRIDLASTSSGVEFPEACGPDRRKCDHSSPIWPHKACECESFAERSGLAPPARGKPYLEGERPACLQMDLDAKACPITAQECQVLWPEGDGLRKLWRVAECAPAPDVVIVLANSGSWAGGGTNDLHPPLAVATLAGIDTWSHRSRLLRHELGHALGLLDEYAVSEAYGGKDGVTPTYHHERNLVMAETGALPTSVPWEHLCTEGVMGLERYAAGACFTVCDADDCDLPTPPPEDQPVVGLFEGGFYSDRRYYHASQACSMQDAEDPMCPACQFFLRGLFEDLGMSPNAGGPISKDDPGPDCPSDPAPSPE